MSLPAPAIFLAAGAALIGWAFLPTFEFMADKWATDPQYSHGFLVPLFSAYLLWRSAKAGTLGLGPTSALTAALGVAVLAAALGLRWLAGGMLLHQLDAAA